VRERVMQVTSDQRGATLIELTVALVVFAVAVAALASALPLSLFSDAWDRNEFVWQARSCAEEIIALEAKSTDFDIGSACPDGAVSDPDQWLSGGELNHCNSLTVNCNDAGSYYQIELRNAQISRPIVLQIPHTSGGSGP